MGKVSAKGAVITVASTDLSAYVESYDIEWKQGMLDVTGFGETWQNYAGGLPIVSLTLNFYWDLTATTGAFAKLKALMTTPGTVSIVPESGGPVISGTFVAEGVNVSGTPTGAIKMGACKLFPSGATIATFAS